jgi:hypothetical protein
VVILLTIALVGVILLVGAVLGSFLYLVKNPPVVNVELPDLPPIVINVDTGNLIPSPLVVQFQSLLPDQTPSGIAEEPMPLDVFSYCAQESEEHARVARQRHARVLRNELGSWDLALTRLKLEDGIS